VDFCVATSRFGDAGENLEQGALPRSVATDDPDNFATFNLERDIIEGPEGIGDFGLRISDCEFEEKLEEVRLSDCGFRIEEPLPLPSAERRRRKGAAATSVITSRSALYDSRSPIRYCLLKPSQRMARGISDFGLRISDLTESIGNCEFRIADLELRILTHNS